MTRQRLLDQRWVAAMVLTFLVSICNALQARVNGAASAFVSSPLTAAMMSVGGGFICALALVLIRGDAGRGIRSLVRAGRQRRLQWWNYLAGMAGVFFILGQATVVPEHGVTLYMVSVVAGQSGASLLVDRFGVGVGPRRLITVSRIAAAALALAGAVLIGVSRPDGLVFAVAGLAWGLGAGGLIAIQYALNGLISRETGSLLVTAALNFFMGFVLLTVLVVGRWVVTGEGVAAPPPLFQDPWLWLGGPLGLVFIAAAAAMVRILGVLAFTVTAVAGQMSGAILLDEVLPTSASVVNGLVLVGVVATFAGVWLAARSGPYVPRQQFRVTE